MLKLKQAEVAEMSGVSEPTVRRLENEEGALGVQANTRDKLQMAFEDAGVRFIGDREASINGGPGVRLEKAES